MDSRIRIAPTQKQWLLPTCDSILVVSFCFSFFIVCAVKIVKSIFMRVFCHIFPAEERCANLWRWNGLGCVTASVSRRWGELQHRQLETAEAGQSLHRERREGEICLDLNPAEMFGLKNFSWKWQSCWRCCKRIQEDIWSILLVMPFFDHLSNKRIKMQQAAGQQAAGHDFQNEIHGRSPCKIQDHPRRLSLDSSVQNGWWNCFDFLRILFQHV